MPPVPPGLTLDETLDVYRAAMHELQADPTRGGPAIGVADWDVGLYRLGQSLLADPGPAHAVPLRSGRCRQVYLASHLYDIGGHTALIGDMVSALGPDACVIVSQMMGTEPGRLPSAIQARLRLPADRVIALPGPSSADRCWQALAILRATAPEHLFLCHHPQDPLGSVLAQPELAPRRLLVHHADATATFGLFVPGVRVIDLNPSAVAPTQLLSLASHLLRLTVPDPGPRPSEDGAASFVTASSGSPHKFAPAATMDYADTIREVLGVTNGVHVHIGPLSDGRLTQIANALDAAGVEPERFLHIPRTPSLVDTLWERQCRVFLASYPVSGARTRVDVLAAGIPYLGFRQPTTEGPPPSVADGQLVWHTWEELRTVMMRMLDTGARIECARRARAEYDRLHHPSIFASTLRAICDNVAVPEAMDAQRRWRSLARMAEGVSRSIETIGAARGEDQERPGDEPQALLGELRASGRLELQVRVNDWRAELRAAVPTAGVVVS